MQIGVGLLLFPKESISRVDTVIEVQALTELLELSAQRQHD